MNKIDSLKKKEIYISYIFFSIFFIICWSQIEDFGVSLDDEIYYLNGVKTYNYVKNFFLSFFNNDIVLAEYRNQLKEWPIVFELLIIFICDMLDVNNIEKIYLISHQVNFTIFFISLLFFKTLIYKRFRNSYISTVSVIFFIISPRLLGESFYNSRDIFFMSLFIFFIYSSYNFLKNKNFFNTIKISIISALLINTKILGIIPIGIFCLLYIYNFLNTKEKLLKEKYIIILFAFTTLISIYLFWPYLWNNPFKNLYVAFRDILIVHENLVVINYYFGDYIQSNLTPWHYRIVWFLITTPLIIIFLFFFGIIYIGSQLTQIIKRTLNKKYNINNDKFCDLLLLLIFFISFFIVIEFNDSKFGGWRHLYYLYPIVVYFSMHALQYILNNKINYISKLLLILLISMTSIYNLYWSYKNHPHQYIYFNKLNTKYFMKNFDLDWWGVTHKNSIEYILKNDNNMKINISTIGFTSLRNSFLFLNEKNKSRVIITNINKADYIIDNKMKRLRNYEEINKKKFMIYYILKVNDHPVAEVYKRIN